MNNGFAGRLERLSRSMPVRLEVIGDINEIINNARDYVKGSDELKMDTLVSELEQYLSNDLPANKLNKNEQLYMSVEDWKKEMDKCEFDFTANPLISRTVSFAIQDLIHYASLMPSDEGFSFIQEDLYQILSGRFDIEERHPELFVEIITSAD